MITEERVVFQCTKVLRYKLGSQLYVQQGIMRYTTEITVITKKTLELKILSELSAPVF
jgi:16S rRNA U1498 N3-methylase RsmE